MHDPANPARKSELSIYAVLEATVRAAIEFTRADAGHMYLIRYTGNDYVVTHQCLTTSKGRLIRQYREDRRALEGPCQESVRQGRMYYVHDAGSNRLHQVLMRQLHEALEREGGLDSLKARYVREYIDFLAQARSYVAVPIKRLDGQPMGVLGLFSYHLEDFFATMERRIIEEYMNNFASGLILALIAKAGAGDPRLGQIIEDGAAPLAIEGVDFQPGRIFDTVEESVFDGTGPYLEMILKSIPTAATWNDVVERIERFVINHLLARGPDTHQDVYRLLKMPKRTFYAKLKRLGIDTAPRKSQQTHKIKARTDD